jgi:drug/metabolite transporter (DMT)-like permease
MGVVNFAGPLLTRRVPVLTVVALGQGVGAALLVLVLIFSWPSPPGVEFFLVALAAGGMAGIATVLAFRAGQVGNIGLVSVIVALSAVVPALGGIAEGERLPLHEWIGIALAGTGTALTLLCGDQGPAGGANSGARSSPPGAVSLPVGAAAAAQPPHPALGAVRRASRNWPLLAFVAAAGFGIFMLTFAKLAERDLFWAGAVTRLSMAFSAILAMVLLRQPMFSPGDKRRQLLPLPFLGLLMVTAVMLFGYAASSILTVASALTAFAPVVTVSLSWIILRERLTKAQMAGIAITIVGLVLIVL